MKKFKKFKRQQPSRPANGIPPREKFDNALKVFVSNLPLDNEFAWKSVLGLCSSVGEVQFENFFVKTIGGQKIQQGLVVFSSVEEAEKSVKFTGHEYGGKHIIFRRHVKFVSDDPNSQTVYVSNLSKETDEEDLWNHFSHCGSIKYIHIKRLLGVSSFQGEVSLEGVKCVKKALKLNDSELNGNKISVTDTLGEQKPSDAFVVVVSGLPAETTQDDVINFFDGCGPIERIKFTRAMQGVKASVFFTDSDSVGNALGCDGSDLNGNVINVQEREVKHDDQFENAIFIAGIIHDIKDVDLFLKYQDCGYIKNVTVFYARQKAVIEFQDPEAVDKALAKGNIELKGEPLMVTGQRDTWLEWGSGHVGKNGSTSKRKMSHDNNGPELKNGKLRKGTKD